METKLTEEEAEALSLYIQALVANIAEYADTIDPDTITEVIEAPSVVKAYGDVERCKEACKSALGRLGLHGRMQL